MVMPIYISELSPSGARGLLVSLIGIMYSMGILVALCANIGLSTFSAGWRVSLAIQAASGLVLATAMARMAPHSPRYEVAVFSCSYVPAPLQRWLVVRQREKEAHHVLAKINGCNSCAQKQEGCLDALFTLEELKEAVRETGEPFKEALQWKYISR